MTLHRKRVVRDYVINPAILRRFDSVAEQWHQSFSVRNPVPVTVVARKEKSHA